MSASVVDFDNIPLDQLTPEQLAQMAADIDETQVPAVQTPAEADPALVAPISEEVVDPNAPVEEYTATIDLEDGSGVQVFSGATKDEVITKLIQAQTHSTRKIKELSRLPAPPAPVAKSSLTPMDKSRLSQELLTDPDDAFDKLFEARTGMTVDEFKAHQKEQAEFRQGQLADIAAREWTAQNPDYYTTPSNGAKMVKWLELNNFAATPENLTKAFTDLDADGLLAKKPGPKPADTRIEEPAPVIRKAASGLSVRGRANPTPTVQTGPTDDELENMTSEQILALYHKAGGRLR